jgi:predicted nucleotide-binding protein
MGSVKILCFFGDDGLSKLQNSIIKELQKQYKNVDFSIVNATNDGELLSKYSVKELPSVIIEEDEAVKARFSGLTQQIFLERALKQLIK